MIDTHAHIYLKEFQEDLKEIIDKSQNIGVEKILMPNINHESIDNLLKVNSLYPDVCLPMMGLHPCYVKDDFEKQLLEIEKALNQHQFVAIGEIGTDLYWDKTFWEQQKIAFTTQMEWGLQKELPVAIHCRNSIDETIELVTPYAKRGLKGVFHCFSGNTEQAQKIMDLGFYLGIGGVVTFKKGGLDLVLPKIGLEKIVLETDSPYLAPVPHRGKRNEPTYLSLICNKIASIFLKDPKQITEITSKNTYQLFG